MAIRVGINGFGRIGRLVFRRLAENFSVFDVVGINDITDTKTLAYLLKYDSVHRRFNGEVCHDAESIIVNGKKIKAMAIKDPTKLPWRSWASMSWWRARAFSRRGHGREGWIFGHIAAAHGRSSRSLRPRTSPT